MQGLLYFLKNFTSELSLEILASVAFMLAEHPQYSIDQVADNLWTSRKRELFKKESIARAYAHLQQYKHSLALA
ncbi:hypothetical protein [Arcticibacter sp. MXS-1]|uniref:hypothetical protein n=1 Tax=Arcticibacter sp. MXS-1 TaxID=3341726 RepID=UPI0035A93532